MKTIEPYFIIESDVDSKEMLRRIESFGRTAYKSESQINDESAGSFIQMLINRGHLSVIEHQSITVRIICDRGISHEIVRHRIASYTQESTRYCNYSDGKFGNELTVIRPQFWDKDDERMKIWDKAMRNSEEAYLKLIELGATPQQARSVLPNSLKTEIVVTMNLREWRHFFKLRASESAHPQMREIADPLLREFKRKYEIVFDDLSPSDGINV